MGRKLGGGETRKGVDSEGKEDNVVVGAESVYDG